MSSFEKINKILEDLNCDFCSNAKNQSFNLNMKTKSRNFKLYIFINKTVNSITFYIPEVYKIKPKKRNIVKTFILDFNFVNLYGNFSIRNRSTDVSYTHSHYLGKSEVLIEEEQILEYLKYTQFIFEEINSQLEELGE